MANADQQSASFRPLAAPDKLWGTTATSAQELRKNGRRVAVDLLRLFLANRTPVTLWGPVGARKTRTIEALARETDENGVPYQVITLQPSTQDPTIIHGMMYTSREGDKTVMRRSVPRVAEQVVEYANTQGGLTVLFADEMTTCMPSQQNAMLGLLTHGKFEDIDISEHIAIVMAANPEGTVSTVIPLNEAVLNRGGHLAWVGDRDLFLEEWSTGFAGATTSPRSATVRLVTAMFRQDPDKVFRAQDDRWKPDTLVPWAMMEHTERAVTEMGRMAELVADVFQDHPPMIAAHYTVEVARALLGPRWADAVKTALDQEADGASKAGVLAWTRRVSPREILAAESLEPLIEEHGTPWSEGLRQDQAAHVLQDLVDGALRDGAFSADHYFGAWALVCAAPSEGDRAGLSAEVGRLAVVGREAIALGLLERASFLPKFASEEVRLFAAEATRAQIRAAAATPAREPSSA